ncbi:MAG: NADH-quinone oxidoreductase subunit C [Euryarchaeota archaeon]|jgi:NADH:ubiquinone oxidoreductase subunit C|nr:NADH-quinone oxidoreductase subunit C [Euryarchaeota archaeon]MBT3653476.1 NADH-quinone oxidoreductase subunit C [Euryarchaeota archaeon]MBT3757580.1 NADH-quinone oxidoreductase subunit C [Euryarchaeota archaeon]MBT4050860.1 NADH-quinone oxidoreductase subunit C [Euryarchaeota archaeon]MBT4346344.1 NADH-quinone oxidoreductase subunit C [Euryarchaeota archaeon]
MRVVSEKTQSAAAEKMAKSLSKMDGVEASVNERVNGTQTRYIVTVDVDVENWRATAESLRNDHEVDYCSMITGIHWPESTEKTWEIVYHFLRTGVTDPAIEEGVVVPNIVDFSKVKGMNVPLELQISIILGDTRTPSVASVQDIWAGADWNEKETWDLVGIVFDGHEGMRRVLNPHESPAGFHPLQKQHKLRYHDHEEMYDDAQGFMRKPSDVGKVK